VFALSAIPYVPGRARGSLRFGPAAAAPGVIVALHQREVAALGARPAGIILIDAAPFSHPTLRLLSQAIPTVLVEQGQLAGLPEGNEVLLDGHSGLLSSPVTAGLPLHAPPSPPEAGRPVQTVDGASVELRASVGSVAASAAAIEHGAASIGLVRSEYLFPEDGSRPDADFLATAFEHICRAAQALPVTFRLLDIAGDKKPTWLGEMPGIAGVLGLQGARLYSTEPVRQVYLEELNALSRLAGQYPVRVLLPYVTSLTELETLVSEIRCHLPSTVSLGVMLETPAAALAVEEFLGEVDFAALGCNDLMQCLFAADRDMPELRAWLDPYAPALYRFLDMVAQRAGDSVSALQVCGLLPQWPGILPVLVGLGYRAFSVDPIMIPWLAQTVRLTDTQQAMQLARAVCKARRPAEVKQLLAEAKGVAVLPSRMPEGTE
jgi:phosphoenolpyruvate-protein kinase (PTS system EI component)